jgi:histidine triad (HIT) family protein
VTAVPADQVAGCDFCAIARGDDSAVQMVCESDSWVAFFPLNPATSGHTLVIPRHHVSDLWELGEPLAAELMGAVIRVGRAVQLALDPEGMNLITSKGRAAEQTVFHLHLHVLPRWGQDGFDRIWVENGDRNDDDLESLRARIAAACAE